MMKPVARMLLMCALSLIFADAIKPVFASDDKNKSDKPALYEKLGDRERIYNLSFDEMWKLCSNAASRTFEKVRSDMDKGTLEMESGISLSVNAFDIVVNLEKVAANRTRVKINTHKKKFLSWGSGDRIAREFFKAVDKQLIPEMRPEIK